MLLLFHLHTAGFQCMLNYLDQVGALDPQHECAAADAIDIE
ncbi:MAG: hypothetical protein ACRECQ_19270 [Burkholderiaceae bacterium]